MSTTPNLFDSPDPVTDADNQRLLNQLQRVFQAMLDGQWHTLAEIADATGDPQASISAQLRHLRKDRFGGHTVDRAAGIGVGTYYYKLSAAGPLLDGRAARPPAICCPTCGQRVRP